MVYAYTAVFMGIQSYFNFMFNGDFPVVKFSTNECHSEQVRFIQNTKYFIS